MPTPLTHAVVGLAAGGTIAGPRRPLRFWAAVLLCAAIPDVDTIGLRLGIPYGHVLGHRGLTHSLAFAAVLALAGACLAARGLRVRSGRWWGLWALLLAVGASHGVLDAMTDGGLGVAFLAPFSAERYWMPWRPIKVAPIGLRRFLSPWGLEVMEFEISRLWVPAVLAFVVATVVRAVRRRPAGGAGEKLPE